MKKVLSGKFERRLSVMVCAFMTMVNGISGASEVVPASIDYALAAPLRTENDRDSDGDRKPRQFLEFTGMKAGDIVAEINAGPGYYARIYPNVVGENGLVFVTNAEFVLKLFDGLQTRLADSLQSAGNVVLSVQEDNELSLPKPLDIAILNNIYHDLHWQQLDMQKWNRSVYDALRPGGVYIVADHKSEPGSGDRDSSTLHRVDSAMVVEEILSAGFDLVEESNLFRNPNDDHTLMIMNPSIRGKTDRMLYKFRKP